MQRMIHIEVTGNRARASSRELGTQGEVAAVTVALVFDEGWNGLAKRLLWRAADGASTGYTLLSQPDDSGVYTAAVPALPLSAAGKASLTVEGVLTSGSEVERRVRSAMLTFRVEPNDLEANSPAQAVDASVAEQLASEIEGKASASHTHTPSDVSDFAHTRAQSDVAGLPDALDAKAELVLFLNYIQDETPTNYDEKEYWFAPTDCRLYFSSYTAGTGYSWNDVTEEKLKPSTMFITGSGKLYWCPGDDIYEAKAAVVSHTHTMSDVTGLGPALAGKAASSHKHKKADITDFAHTHVFDAGDVACTVDDSPTTVAAALDSLFLEVEADRVGEYTGTLASSGWSGSEAPFTQSVSCSAVDPYSHALVNIAASATDAQYEAGCAACLRFSCGSGMINAKAYGVKPSVDVPLKIGVMR